MEMYHKYTLKLNRGKLSTLPCVPGRESDVSGCAMKYLYGMSDTSRLGNVDGNRYIAMIVRGENKRYFRKTRPAGRRGISLGFGI